MGVRWPVLRDIICSAGLDVLCMQAVEETDAPDVVRGLGAGYETFYFKHEKRPPDGLMIAVDRSRFEAGTPREMQWAGAAIGSIDLVHLASGLRVRVVTIHARGGKADQLEALATFADDDNDCDVTVVTGDFNEDFRSDSGVVRCPCDSAVGSYATLHREESLPQLSRPPHKQAEDQSSGKGKIDYIFVRGRGCVTELFRDEASLRAVLLTHQPCEATGEWPSDHGAEALCVRAVRTL